LPAGSVARLCICPGRDGGQSVTRAEGSGGGEAISVNREGLGNRTTIAQSGSGDIYAGHDGNVYRKTEDGWQQHGDGGWTDVDVPDRPGESGERSEISKSHGTGAFDRGQLDGRSRDAARDRAAEQGGQRYGGSGSLESRSGGSDAGTRGQSSYHTGGSSTGGARPTTSNYSQLNRDAAARSGSYQNYERRTSSGSMSRGGGVRRGRR